jgi:hypothetical protein
MRGEATTTTVTLEPLEPAPAEAHEERPNARATSPNWMQSAPPASGSPTGRMTGLVLMGVGAAGLAAGGAFGIASILQHDSAAKACPTTPCTTQDGVDSKSNAIVYGNVSTWSFVGGGVLAATGAIVFFSSGARGSENRIGMGDGSGLRLGLGRLDFTTSF